MQFLNETPIVSLKNPTNTNTFVADLFQPRPAIEEIPGWSVWCADAATKMEAAMQRKNSAVRWVRVVLDGEGALLIMQFQHPLVLGAAKSATVAILRCLPAVQYEIAKQSLRPLDEVDKNRIVAWQTPTSLRPKGNKRARPDDDDEGQFYVPPIPIPKSLDEFLADWHSGDEEEVPPPRLMIADDTVQTPPVTLSLLDPTSIWSYRLEKECVILLIQAGVVQIGGTPMELDYVRCHWDARRQLLLQDAVKSRYTMPRMRHVVEVAVELAKGGSIPGPFEANGAHGRQREFMKKCSAALTVLNPAAEHDLQKVSSDDRRFIRVAFGETTEEACRQWHCMRTGTIPSWTRVRMSANKPEEEEAQTMSVCNHCGIPKLVGVTMTLMEWEDGAIYPPLAGRIYHHWQFRAL